MKQGIPYVLGLVLGVALCAALFLVTAQPRGQVVTLLPPPTSAPLLVDVSGAVANPGVYALSPGSRIQDALEQAGGTIDEADLASLNLAARVKDGQKLLVPAIRGQQSGAESGRAEPNALSSPITYPIDLNLATLEELDSLPNIGLTRAQQIIDFREARGGFRNIDELMDVPGIGPSTFAQLKELVSVDTQP